LAVVGGLREPLRRTVLLELGTCVKPKVAPSRLDVAADAEIG